MKCQKISSLLLSLVMFMATAVAQQPKKKLPVKNPPQYPHIIDLENKETPSEKGELSTTEQLPQLSEQLVRAVQTLASEVQNLVKEMRALNLRQQAQLEMLRLTRAESQIELYEKELRETRERIARLEADERNLNELTKPESLLAQTQNIGTFDRQATMRQIKAAHEANLRNVIAHKEVLQKREAELVVILEGYRTTNSETEKRLKLAEEMIRQLESPPPAERQP